MKGKENKHVRRFRETKLTSSETIVSHLEGWIGEVMGTGKKTQHNGQLILTNKRICFYRKGILGEVLETIPVEKITSVEALSRLGYRVLRCHTSHDELAFKTFEAKDTFDELYNALEACRSTSGQITAREERPASSITEDLSRLGEMLKDGLITQEEFADLKGRLIRG